MSIPRQVLYDSVKPFGYPTSVKQIRFMPTTGQSMGPNDIVRFNISTSGYWDPSTAYINLQLQLDDSFMDLDAIQLDGSASSLISEFVATVKGVELERIQEYDQIANILEDIYYSNEQRLIKEIQGLGNNCKATTKTLMNNIGTNCFLPNAIWDATNPTRYSYASCKPTFVPSEGNLYSGEAPLNSNFIWNCRNENIGFNINNSYGDGSGDKTVLNGATNVFHTQCQVIKNISSIDTDMGIWKNPNAPSPVANTNDYRDILYNGFYAPFNNDLCQGCFEPVISKGCGVQMIIDGKITNRFCESREFAIPIYSGLFGCLMQKRDLKYLPMQALQDLVLEFRLNPYGVFTTGFQNKLSNGTDDAILPNNCAGHNLLQRKYKITKFEIVVEMLYFDNRIDSMINSQLNSSEGIVFHSQSWMLGPVYSISPSTTPSGTYQLNLGFESLKCLCVTFLMTDYLQKPFVRKLNRVSAGITSIQFRIGNELFPSLPIKGHSGTAGGHPANYGFENNNEYLINLYKAFDKWLNVDEDCSINNNNFALNGRYYPVSTVSPSSAFLGATTALAILTQSNTAILGLPLFYENKAKGKAIYAMNFEALPEDKNVISGLNTIINRPFELLFTSDSSAFPSVRWGTGNTPFGYNMYLWCNFDMIIKLGKYNASVLGRG